MSSDAVRLVQLSRTSDTLRVDSFAVAPLPQAPTGSGQCSEFVTAGEVLARLIRQRPRLTGAPAVASLASSETRFTWMQVAACLSDADLDAMIADDAANCLPCAAAEAVWDFSIRGLCEAEPQKANLLLAASRHSHVMNLQTALRSAGLRPIAVEPEALALWRGVHSVHGKDSQSICVLDLGAAHCRLLRYLAGQPPVLYTESCIRNAGAADAGETDAAKAPDDAVPALVEAALRCFKRCRAEGNCAGVRRLLLTGSRAGDSVLAKALQARLNQEVLHADPFADARLADNVDATGLRQAAPGLMTAFGLALWPGR